MDATLARATAGEWPLACPACPPRPGLMAQRDGAACPVCGRRYPYSDGVWDLLPDDRAERFAPFLSDYAAVRAAEGRHLAPAALRRLPETDPHDPRAWEWGVRAATFRALARDVLPQGTARILDLGAGNGWLSYRLHLLGHRPAAVDLSVDPSDGLRAAQAFDTAADSGPGGPLFPRLRAEFDRLPLAARCADVVIFNSSLHYSADYRATLGEALRVVTAGGRLVVADSPLYRRAADGDAMVAERKALFRQRYGVASDRHGGREYLTWDEITALGDELGIAWRVHRPDYGLRYRLRPVRARLAGRRRPSLFALLEGRRT